MRQMPIVEIIRLEESDQGTFGVLRVNKQVFCCTLEPHDRLNEVGVSSIPAQQYTCVKYISQTHGATFRVENVPGRSGIIFHPGNTQGNTRGCILLARYFGWLQGRRAILSSGVAFREFMNDMANHPFFHLTVKEHY